MVARKRPIVWSTVARADLAEIWNYYVNVAGRHTADKIIREIGEACRLIEDHPFAGQSRNEVFPSLRSIVVSPHVIFYRVNKEVPEVVRVLDGRRDLDEMFGHDPNKK